MSDTTTATTTKPIVPPNNMKVRRQTETQANTDLHGVEAAVPKVAGIPADVPFTADTEPQEPGGATEVPLDPAAATASVPPITEADLSTVITTNPPRTIAPRNR